MWLQSEELYCTNQPFGGSLARIGGDAKVHEGIQVVAVRNGKAVSKAKLLAKHLTQQQRG